MFTLPTLPFAENSLEPHMSAETIKTHHGKHHKKYIDTLNDLIKGSAYEDKSLEQIIIATCNSGTASDRKIFNNASQSWNHDFLWKSFTPQYGRPAGNKALAAIDNDFGSFEHFKKIFVEEGVKHFGSGWVWLVAGRDALKIISTHDADLPLAHGKHALLTCDLWEHAYYLDYKNDRESFLETFVDNLANWAFAERNLASVPRSV